jgi:hypothetical protein
LLHGVKEARFSNIVFISLIITLVFFIVAEFTKKKLKFYPKD